VLFGVLGLARLMRFVPRSVMLGFVNALGVLIFAAQVPHLLDVPFIVYPLFALTLAVVLLLPRVTTAVPAALVAIVLVTLIAVLGGLHVPTVGDEGEVSGGLPGLTAFTVPLNAETLAIVWPTALSVAFVGLLETLLTAKLVDRITDTPSRKNRESWGLGVANIGAGLWGGIGGCAMIGQTLVNVKAGGGRTRVSTGVAAVFLLGLLTALGPVLAVIPMVALAAVMMVVAVTTVDWHSLRPATLRRMPLPETAVMVLTVAVVLLTNNLALGVGVGVLLAMVLFARRVAHVTQVDRVVAGDVARYTVRGPLFFGSSNDLVDRFSVAEDPQEAVVDLTHAQVWDASTVAALDAIEQRYADHGRRVRFEGLDERSTDFHARLTGRLGG
jgi:SulP family sulfate permease